MNDSLHPSLFLAYESRLKFSLSSLFTKMLIGRPRNTKELQFAVELSSEVYRYFDNGNPPLNEFASRLFSSSKRLGILRPGLY